MQLDDPLLCPAAVALDDHGTTKSTANVRDLKLPELLQGLRPKKPKAGPITPLVESPESACGNGTRSMQADGRSGACAQQCAKRNSELVRCLYQTAEVLGRPHTPDGGVNAAGTRMHTAIAAGKGRDREPHAAACPLETMPGALCRPAAGKPSQRETWQSVATMITTEAPFATHGFVHSRKDQVNMEGLDNAWEAVAHRVLHERQIWAAAKLQSQGPKNVHARRKGCNLQAADAMWFDASMPMLQQYPLRACWGRYCS